MHVHVSGTCLFLIYKIKLFFPFLHVHVLTYFLHKYATSPEIIYFICVDIKILSEKAQIMDLWMYCLSRCSI